MLGDVQKKQKRLVHTVAGQTVQGFGDKHRARRNFAVLDALQKTTEFARQRVVATESRNADVLQGFGDLQAVGLHKPQCGIVLPTFAVAPCLRLRRESDVDIRL